MSHGTYQKWSDMPVIKPVIIDRPPTPVPPKSLLFCRRVEAVVEFCRQRDGDVPLAQRPATQSETYYAQTFLLWAKEHELAHGKPWAPKTERRKESHDQNTERSGRTRASPLPRRPASGTG